MIVCRCSLKDHLAALVNASQFIALMRGISSTFTLVTSLVNTSKRNINASPFLSRFVYWRAVFLPVRGMHLLGSSCLEDYWACPGGFSPLNAIGLRNPINSVITRCRLAVEMSAVTENRGKEQSP